MNGVNKLAVVCLLVGTILLAGPAFGFSTIAADRGATVATVQDEDAYLSLFDNTDQGLVVNGEGDTAAIYDLADRNSEFAEGDFTVDVPLLEDPSGDVIVDPPMIGTVTGSGDEFQLHIECDPNDDAGVNNDDYLVTVDILAAGADTTIDLKRETNDWVSIKCQGPEPDSPPFYMVNIDDQSDSTAEEGDLVEITANITNEGDEAGTKDVWLEVDGSEVDRTDLSLTDGETDSVSLTWQTEAGDAGDREVTVVTEDDEDTRTVTVREELVYDITILETTDSGKQVDVTIDADTNDPAAEIEVQVIKKNGDIKSSKRVAVADDQPQTITVSANGDYDHVRVILYDGNGDEQARDTAATN